MNPTPPQVEHLAARDGYDRWAAIYDDEHNPLIGLEEIHLPPLLGDLRGLRIIDLGCGTGRVSVRLARQGAIVTAVDFSEGMLARARQRPEAGLVRFESHDVTRPLPYAGAAFDRVVSCLVLEHIADLPSFFAECGRLSRPGGAIILSAMHPAMLLRGISARFVDPQTGVEVRPQSHPNQISDYVMAGLRAGLALDHLSEHVVDEALASRCPRAVKYVGWPMLLLMRLRKPEASASAATE